MKKSIKRFLVLTQVLGWSALVATACTDNDKTVAQKSEINKDATKSDKKDTTLEGSKGSAQGTDHQEPSASQPESKK